MVTLTSRFSPIPSVSSRNTSALLVVDEKPEINFSFFS